MLTVNSEDRARIAPLFADMEDTMIRSCLQGRMGEAYADALPPACAQILLGDFAFLAGDVQASGAEELVRHIPRYLLVIPKEPRWGPCLQSAHGERCRVVTATPPRGIPVSTGNSLAGWPDAPAGGGSPGTARRAVVRLVEGELGPGSLFPVSHL